MTAEVISIGDELLIGQIINTNAAYLGEQLSSMGIPVHKITTVGDNVEDLSSAFAQAWDHADVVITTGGLGPTHDDVTRQVAVDFFSTTLVFSNPVFMDIRQLFEGRGRKILDLNRDQAFVPEAARIMRNHRGTAPGFHFSQGQRHFFITPGVPYEMEDMFEREIRPVLQPLSVPTRAVRTLLSTGIAESDLADRLRGMEVLHPGITMAYLPSPSGVRMRIAAVAETSIEAERRVDSAAGFIRDRIGEFIYGEGVTTLAAVVGEMLRQRGATVAIAESCTGGLIADKLTDTPGSSEYLDQCAVVYSNDSKTRLLGVPEDLIQTQGAVSEQVARAMAEGVRASAGTTFGISTTGIAGPSGGTDTKPIGLVWFGLSTETECMTFNQLLGKDRLRVKERAATMALDALRRFLQNLPMPASTFP